MDLSKFTTELNQAGFTVTTNEERFKTIDDLCLPFMGDNAMFYTINQSLLKDANYIYKTKTPCTKEKLAGCKVFTSYGKTVLNWIQKHMDKVQIVNSGTVHKTSGPFVQTKEEQYKKDTEYGLSVLTFYIQYSRQNMTFCISMQNGFKLDAKFKTPGVSTWDYYQEDKIVSILNAFAEIAEFVPLDLNETDSGVYWNFTCDSISTWTSSYGENILNDKFSMDRLEKDGFFANGIHINPNAWYFFVCGDDSRCFLKRDTKKSPKMEVS